MRRYGLKPATNTVPGQQRVRDITLVKPQQQAAAVVQADSCEQDIVGVRWRDPSTDEWTLTDQELLVFSWGEPKGPDWLAAARLEGELCCCKPEWSYTWIPVFEGAVEPPILISGNLFLVYPTADAGGYLDSISTGVVEVTATCGEYTSPPTTLTIAEDTSGYY